MRTASLEHVNVTVIDPEPTARLLIDIFGWRERWRGEGKAGGATIHVGSETDYIAIYTHSDAAPRDADAGKVNGGLNHIGLVVDDLDAVEAAVVAAGYQPFNHGDYEPGRRFYFNDVNGVEFEIVSYA